MRRLSLLLPLALLIAGCSGHGPAAPSSVADQATLSALGPTIVVGGNHGQGISANVNGVVAGLPQGHASVSTSFSFVADGQQIHGDASTEFYGGSTFSDLVDGARVVVHGTWEGAAVHADRIHVTGAPASGDVSPAPTPTPAFGAGPAPDLLNCQSYTCGFSFAPTEDIQVTDLGQWDDASDGLGADAPVGLWTGAGVLLASTTVPAGTAGTLVGQYRYVSIAPVLLQAGQQYVIASAYTAGLAPLADVSGFDPAIAPAGGQVKLSNGTLLFPDMPYGSLLGGANFQFVPATTTAASTACARPGACR